MFSKPIVIRYLCVIFLCLPSHLAEAQLKKSANDTIRLQKFIAQGLQLLYSHSDSALHYAQQGLTIAQKLDRKEDEAKCLSIIGNILVLHQSYPAALEANIKTLKIREDLKNEAGVAKSYVNIGRVYTEMNDYEHALQNYFKAKLIFEKLIQSGKDLKSQSATEAADLFSYRQFLGITLLNIGDTYDRWGKLDSAMAFQKQANFIAEQSKDSNALSYTFINLGSIYAKLGNYPFAISNYKESLPYLLAQDDRQSLATAYHGLAEVYLRSNEIDSSFLYAKKIALYADDEEYKKERYGADTLLSKLFKLRGMNDSALHYYELANRVAVSMDVERQSVAVQNMKLNESYRQTERARQEAADKEKRSYNLQMLGIGIFITTFMAALFMLSKRKTKHRSYKFFGLIGLLLLFEFIMYFLHPYISDLTHHTPVYVLIITVGIAAILAPLHHRSVHWVETKLAKKTRGRPRKDAHDHPAHPGPQHKTVTHDTTGKSKVVRKTKPGTILHKTDAQDEKT